MRRVFLPAVMVLVLVGCGKTPGEGDSTAPAKQEAPKGEGQKGQSNEGKNPRSKGASKDKYPP
jgi:hypothetical protein